MKRLLLLFLMCSLALPLATAVSCDCHPDGVQNRVCLFTVPTSMQLSGDTFSFAIKVRNYFRSSTGGSITDINTEIVSCQKQGGGSCTYSASGDTDFRVTINPSYIASSPAGDYGYCGDNCNPTCCSACTTGRVENVNAGIQIWNAADGTYTIRYRVSWEPRSLSRFIDVTFSFQSEPSCSDECSPSGSRQCSGTSYRTCGDFDADSCLEWGSLVACPDARCKTPTCSGGVCGEVNVGAGLTDEACYGSVGCSGGSCKCDGVGSCTSQPACTDTCSSLGFACGTQSVCGVSVNCGACSNAHGTTSCSAAGLCQPVCSSGYGDCDGNTVNGCETQLGTMTNCASCGNACASGYSCTGGSCVLGCSDECSPSGSRQCSGTSYRTCGDFDADSCLEWGSLVACPDARCKTPTCSGGVCGEVNVGAGLTDEACYGSVGCSGGSCKCDGAGLCASQPDCADTCSSLGFACGTQSVCGVSVNCGACATGYVCDGGSCVLSASCTQASDCDDDNLCTTDACANGVCSYVALTDMTTCAGGYCCAGVCDTTIGHASYHDDCRGDIMCDGTNAVYTAGNDGEVCGDFACRTCLRGSCVIDTDSLCESSQTCANGVCVEKPLVDCLTGHDCDDGNSCTVDSCANGVCSNERLDGTSCTGCAGDQCVCRSGTCLCQPDCQINPCAGDGCGGTCAACEQGLAQGGTTLVGGENESGSQQSSTSNPDDGPGLEAVKGDLKAKRRVMLFSVTIGVLLLGSLAFLLLRRRKPPLASSTQPSVSEQQLSPFPSSSSPSPPSNQYTSLSQQPLSYQQPAYRQEDVPVQQPAYRQEGAPAEQPAVSQNTVVSSAGKEEDKQKPKDAFSNLF